MNTNEQAAQTDVQDPADPAIQPAPQTEVPDNVIPFQAPTPEAPPVNEPAVSAEHIDSVIVSTEETPAGVVLTLRNGFTVEGESVADARAFVATLESYLLCEAHAQQQVLAKSAAEMSAQVEKQMAAVRNSMPEIVARVAHQVNRAYCAALGDDSQPAWEDAPEWQRKSAIQGVQFLLDNPKAGPWDSHKNWVDAKLADGWTYGKTKNPERKEHPCMVPFVDLPVEQRAKDFIFHAVVHGVLKPVAA
jgi:hypothetical protein